MIYQGEQLVFSNTGVTGSVELERAVKRLPDFNKNVQSHPALGYPSSQCQSSTRSGLITVWISLTESPISLRPVAVMQHGQDDEYPQGNYYVTQIS